MLTEKAGQFKLNEEDAYLNAEMSCHPPVVCVCVHVIVLCSDAS